MIQRFKECKAERKIGDAVHDIVRDAGNPPGECHIDTADKEVWNRTECAKEQTVETGEDREEPDRSLPAIKPDNNYKSRPYVKIHDDPGLKTEKCGFNRCKGKCHSDGL